MLLRGSRLGDIRATIMIHGQGEHPVRIDGVTHSLLLQFDDIEAPSATDRVHAYRVRSRQRQAASVGLVQTPPCVDHARSILDFAQSIGELGGTVLCQCQGGVSRSPAAALLCMATWTGPGREEYCVQHVISVRPSAMPHRDLVAFGDELLHREGRLVKALDRILEQR